MQGLHNSLISISMLCWPELLTLQEEECICFLSLKFFQEESQKFIGQVLPPVRPAVRGERDLLVQRDRAEGGEDDHWQKRD